MMPKIQVNGIDLFYDLKGNGGHPTLLLLGGFDCDTSYWSLVMPFLVKHYQVIRVDNRGVGQSSAPDRSYNILQMAEDAAALVEHLGITKVHAVGHSMGGQIAQELTLSHPDQVESLILLASWAKGDARFNAQIKLFGDLPSQLERTLYYRILFSWMFTAAFYAIPEAIENMLAQIQSYPFLSTPQGLYHQSRAILASDTSDRLTNIGCPCLVAVGKDDLVTPVKFSHQLAQGIPYAKLLVLEQGGHGLLIESAEVVANVILNFLAQQG
jgi:3-oxoadipate enol-lactonase